MPVTNDPIPGFESGPPLGTALYSVYFVKIGRVWRVEG